MMQAKQLTIRNVSPALAERLRDLSESRQESVNSTVLYLLQRALDVNERRSRLARYATWTAEEQTQFDGVLRAQRVVDEKAWR